MAAGQFIIPKKLEAVFRYAYANRVKDADNPYTWSYLATNANQTNYRVPVLYDNQIVNAREGILREYTVGLNYYRFGHNQKFMIDYSRLIRDSTEPTIRTTTASRPRPIGSSNRRF